jgi:hypothetical protein
MKQRLIYIFALAVILGSAIARNRASAGVSGHQPDNPAELQLSVVEFWR